jgi:hypothetical protein
MPEFIASVALVTIVGKTVDFIRYLVNGNWNGVVTQLVAWALGIGAVFLFANSDFAEEIPVGSAHTLGTLGAASLIIVGMSAASTFGVVSDVRKAVDNSDTARIPHLIPPVSQ